MESVTSLLTTTALPLCFLLGLALAAQSTCSMPSVKAGSSATLTCNFGQNLQTTQVPFSIEYYKDNNTQTAVVLLSCQWESSAYVCPTIYPNIDFDRKVSTTVSIVLPAAKEIEGKYLCQTDSIPVQPASSCWFKMPVIISSASSEETSPATRIGTIVGIIAIVIILGVAGAVLIHWKKEELREKFCSRWTKTEGGEGPRGEEDAAIPLSAGPIFKGPPPADGDGAAAGNDRSKDGKANGAGDAPRTKKKVEKRVSSERNPMV